MLRMKAILVLAALLLTAMVASAVTPAATDKPVTFVKGDRWCAVGDSITHGGDWHKFVYLYYATRFPTERFDPINCGSGGDTAAGTLRRLDWDVLPNRPTVSTVMLGMNDIWAENGKVIGPNDYIRDLATILERLQAAGSRVLVITPSPYDGTVKSSSPLDHRRDGLERYAQQVRDLAAAKHLPLLDFYKPMTELTLKMQASDPAFTLLSTDRVHPSVTGHLVMAYLFLKYQGCGATVSAVSLEAGKSSPLSQENCQVKDLQTSGDLASFSLLEKSLPFPTADLGRAKLDVAPFIQELNQETLQVKGLAAGQYELKIDNTAVATFSADQLDQGVNLATLAKAPQNRQAQHVADLNTKRHAIYANKLRFIVMLEHGELKTHFALDDAVTPRAAIDARIAKFKDPKTAQEQRKMYDRYLEYKAQQSKLIQEAQGYLDEMWKANQPTWHSYVIAKKS